jgi:predicted PurR-regulated permease PerM
LFVGIADLVPLVGVTLGAVVAGVAAFIHSVPAGIAVVVFFVLYQQLENHLLQPVVFADRVGAIRLATELAGVLGALLAIPVAGIIQLILRDLWAHRRRPKPPPGSCERPRSHRPGGGPDTQHLIRIKTV